MATPVYYNFNPISITAAKDDYKKAQILITNATQQAVMKLNDINYFAYSLYITTQDSSGFLIIKCLADPVDMTSNTLFFAIPLVIPPQTNTPKSDVDNIMAGGSVTLDLQKYLKPGDAKVSATQNRTTTVVAKTFTIPVQTPLSNSFSGSIPNLQIKNARTDATLTKQELDWVMSCDLLDENGTPYPNPTMNDAVKQKDTANTITFLMMLLLIGGAAYFAGPMVYKLGGLYNIAEVLGVTTESKSPNHFALNIYWGIILITAGIFCVINGALTKQDLYYFLAGGLILAYFAATNAILKMEGVSKNDEGKTFKAQDGMFAYISAINNSESPLVLTGKLPATMGMFSAALYWLGMLVGFIMMIVGVADKNKEAKRVVFGVGISLFLILPAISMLIVGSYTEKLKL
jgi:hypothetical protein